jgi:general secretion pathway protein A
MYESYWGLNARPFDPRDDAAFYYPAESQHAALVKLRYALEHGCAAALAGAPGTGKTLLTELLAAQFASQGWTFVRLAFPLLSPGELLAYLADELTRDEPPLSDACRPIDQNLRRFEGSLAKLAADNKRVAIVIDEAHTIEDSRAWEALRLLLNLGNGTQTSPILIFAGQTRLMELLARLPHLEERLTARCLLPPFSQEETAAYIGHRLQASGAQREIFAASAVDAIHALAQGTPRRINRLADLALLVGYAEELQTIVAEQIEAVAEELSGLQGTATNTDSR